MHFFKQVIDCVVFSAGSFLNLGLSEVLMRRFKRQHDVFSHVKIWNEPVILKYAHA